MTSLPRHATSRASRTASRASSRPSLAGGTGRLPCALTGILILASLVHLGGACTRHASAPPPMIPSDSPADTALGPGDVFTVEVFGEKDLSGKFRVAANGTIDYPFAGSVKVAGMTPSEVAAFLRRRLADGYLKDPNVSVFVESYNSKKISVFGQVQKPGTFNYMNNMSIIEAITLAGGFTPIASKNSITITRSEGGKSRRFVVPVEEIGEGRAVNYLLRPGDIVFVPERLF